jgi:hypothetical protein
MVRIGDRKMFKGRIILFCLVRSRFFEIKMILNDDLSGAVRVKHSQYAE